MKKNKSGVMVHLIITVIGVGGAFFAGWYMAGSGKGEAETQFNDLKSGIEANKKQIAVSKGAAVAAQKAASTAQSLASTAKRLADSNRGQIQGSSRKIDQLTGKVTSTQGVIASADKGMSYVNNVLAPKWVSGPKGHSYCLTPYPMPFKHAQQFAQRVGGTLVVIDDEAENKWIVSKFGSDTEYWIGLTDERDESKWVWVNDLDLVYKNWAPGEPDNYRKKQHHVIMNIEMPKGAEQPGKWKDISGNESRIGIIEASRRR